MNAIRIRETEKRDLKALMDMWNDGEVMKFVGFPNGLGMNEAKMDKWYDWIKSQPDTRHYAIIDMDKGFCGETFYSYKDKDAPAVLDIKLMKAARGNHLGNMALSFAIDMLFKNTDATRAYVDPNKENLPAVALYKRLGFEAIAKENTEYPDAVYMEIDRESWKETRREGIRLAPVDKENFEAVCLLRVADEQRNFVATNSFSLAEAAYKKECVPNAIYTGYNMVGFLMQATDSSDHLEWIYRLMVDKDFQGLGYGKRALELAMEILKEKSKEKVIRISFEPENLTARKLYEKLGFEDTGEMSGDETLYEYRW